MEESMIIEGRRRLDEIERRSKELKRQVMQGSIKDCRGRYDEGLLIIGFASWEAESYARLGYIERAVQSLVDARLGLDGIASSCIELGGQLDELESAEELYNRAKKIYDESLKKVDQIMGGSL